MRLVSYGFAPSGPHGRVGLSESASCLRGKVRPSMAFPLRGLVHPAALGFASRGEGGRRRLLTRLSASPSQLLLVHNLIAYELARDRSIR